MVVADGAKQPDEKLKKSNHANDILIAHADRLWASANQNALRIAQRIQLLGGGTVLFLAMGFNSLAWLSNPPAKFLPHPNFMLLLRGLFTVSVILLFLTLSRLYIRAGRLGNAADQMEIDEDDVGRPIRSLVFRKTYQAYLVLRERTEEEKIRFRQAQKSFGLGVACSVLTAILYLVGCVHYADVWPKGVLP